MQNKLEKYYADILKRSQSLRKLSTPQQDLKLSYFCADIFTLCRDYDKKLPTKWPWYDGDLSNERLIQIQILDLLLTDQNEGFIDEGLVYLGAVFVHKHCTTMFLPSDLNGFQSSLGGLIDRFDCSKVTLDYSTYAKLERYKILEFKENQGMLNEAIIQYRDKLSEDEVLQVIEKRLGESGKETCLKIIEELKTKAGQEILSLKLELQTGLQEIQKKHEAMKKSMGIFIEDISWAIEIIKKYHEAYPHQAEKFGADRFLDDLQNKYPLDGAANLLQVEDEDSPRLQ